MMRFNRITNLKQIQGGFEPSVISFFSVKIRILSSRLQS